MTESDQHLHRRSLLQARETEDLPFKVSANEQHKIHVMENILTEMTTVQNPFP